MLEASAVVISSLGFSFYIFSRGYKQLQYYQLIKSLAENERELNERSEQLYRKVFSVRNHCKDDWGRFAV